MFTGFNQKMPEYEVITPHTKLSFTVRSMTVQEEEKMKGSLVTPAKVLEHLNVCIFDCIVKKPAGVTDFNSFLKAITVKDRDTLLYGLYHITYEDVRNYEVTCSSCSNKHQVTVKASDTFNFNPYPGDDILKKTVKVDLPSMQGVTAYIKQPTLEDEFKLTKEISGITDTSTESLIISKFEQVTDAKEPQILDRRSDILAAYMTILPKDRRALYQTYMDNFGNYGIELKMQITCPKCGVADTTNIDLVESFFRNLVSA